MKSVSKIVLLSLLAIVLVTACVLVPQSDDSGRYLRIHIRANSNLNADQDVKYAVKEAIVEVLTPLLANATTKQDAIRIVNAASQNIEQAAEQTLRRLGFSYGVRVKLCREEFPVRSYGGYTLGAGVYDALIVELGNAQGDNWWCVVYPPLCFVGYAADGSFYYVSKLEEIIRRFYNM